MGQCAPRVTKLGSEPVAALSRKDMARQTVEALERHNLRLPVIHERAVTAARLLHLRRMTFKRQLPAWLDELRPQLTDWVVIAYEAGANSMDEFRGMRFSINGEALTVPQRKRWEKEAAHWFELLLTGPVPGRSNRNVNCVNNSGTTIRSNNSRSRQGGWA